MKDRRLGIGGRVLLLGLALTLTGLEISVELEDGELIVVIQAADDVFRVEVSVRVLRRSDGGVRVMQ